MRQSRSGLRSWIGAGVFIAAIAVVAAPAAATGASEPVRRGPVVVGPGNTVVVQSPSKVIVQSPAPSYAPKHAHGYTEARHSSGACYPFGCDYRGPSYPFGKQSAKAPVPAYVGRRWVSPHWAPQWVPQYYVYQVWVPSYFSDAGWVQGYYEDRSAESGGYYQQVWVDGYWEE